MNFGVVENGEYAQTDDIPVKTDLPPQASTALLNLPN